MFDDAVVRGKTMLLVGARSSRSFILEETKRVADQLGLDLYLLDKPENRAHSKGMIPDDHFIAAPIDKRDDATMRDIAKQVAAFAQTRRLDIVTAFRSHHAKLTGRISREIRAIGVPKDALFIAEDKTRTRMKLNTLPEQRVPYRRVTNAAEVREAFREIAGAGGKVVMKTNLGENSRFLTLGIGSEEEAVKAFKKTDAALTEYAKLPEAAESIFNKYPGILMERMLVPAPGTHEASVEVVMQKGKAAFAIVSDTHGIGPKGDLAGGTMVFPSQQPDAVQRALIAGAVDALIAVGILDGSARVDMFMTLDGARVIEINPFMGGAGIWKAVKLVTGISLVEYHIRALLGLRLAPVAPPTKVVDYRFGASAADGKLEAVTGLEEAKADPRAGHVQLLASAGDRVSGPEGNSFEESSEVMGLGATLEEAVNNSVAVLRRLRLFIRKDDGALVEHTADYLQPGPILKR